MRKFVVVLALAGLFAAGGAHATDHGYVRITGSKSGVIKSDGMPKAWTDANEVLAIDYASTPPAAAGTRRIQTPVTLTLKWTAATPLLFQAATSGEVLSKVSYSGVVTTAEGTEAVKHHLELANARITSFKIQDHNGADPLIDPIVILTLSYQKIVLMEDPGGVTAEDDWVQ